jgi:diadenosine tetraphosphate (Ap4A) HIT family hydrolase
MNNCLFCSIIQRELPAEIVYEDDAVLAFLDIAPVTKGHTLFIPKEHAENLTENASVVAEALMRAVQKEAPRITEALGGTGYNLGMNHGVDAGQEVFHTHLHVMPRYAGMPRNFEKTSVSSEELAEIGVIIRGYE